MAKQHEVITHLLRRGLLTTEQIVAGDIELNNASRRHANVTVTISNGPSYFVKLGLDAEKRSALANEASVYRVFAGMPERSLRDFTPALVHYDEEHAILVLELVEGARNFRQVHAGGSLPSPGTHAMLGESLALLHRATGTRTGSSEQHRDDPVRLPWIFSIHRPTPKTLPHASRANIDLIQAIEQSPELCAGLEILQQEWNARSLIHHDIRWDNLLVTSPSNDGGDGGLKIVDWELTAPGDPCWDIGSVFHDYLDTWLAFMPVAADLPGDRLPELAACPLEPMQPLIASFWHAYVRALAIAGPVRSEWLIRAVKFAAARLLQTVYERMQQSTELTSTAVAALQLSMNMLERPREAALYLLALDPDDDDGG